MSLVKWAFVGLLTLPAAELVVLLLATATLGWFWTVVLLLGASLTGIYLLRQTGRGDFDRLRAAFAQEGLRAIHLETPGFATMLVRFCWSYRALSPTSWASRCSCRHFAAGPPGQSAAPPGAGPRRQDPSVIDLEPHEWRQLPDPGKKRRRKPKSGE